MLLIPSEDTLESVVGKVHLILKALLKEANKNSQAVFSEEKTVRPAKKKKKTTQKAISTPLHKLFFISRETGRLSVKVQRTPRGRLFPSVLRVHPGEQLQKLLGLGSARFHLSLQGRTCFDALQRLEAWKPGQVWKEEEPSQDSRAFCFLEHFHSGSSLTRIQIKLNTHTDTHRHKF